MQAILLGLGTLLLAVAGVVFTAVNWSRMDAATQGVVLLGLAGAAAAATVLASRRGLPATAEALGLVTLVLALVNGHAVRISVAPHAGLAAFWAVGLTVVSLLAWCLANAADIRSTRLVAVVSGQVPVFLVMVAANVSAATAGVVVLGQVAAVLVITTPRGTAGRRLDPMSRIAALIPAAYGWAVITGAAGVWLAVDGARANPSLVAVMAMAVVVAVLAAVCWAHRDAVRDIALIAATLAGLATSGWSFRLLADGEVAWAMVGLTAAVVVGAGTRSPSRWGSMPAGTAVWAAVLVACSLLVTIDEVVRRLGLIAADPWSLDAAQRAMPPESMRSGDGGAWAVALHLLSLGALLWALVPRFGRRAVLAAAPALLVMAVGLTAVVFPLSIGGAAAVAWVAAVAVLGAVEIWSRSAPAGAMDRTLVRRGGALTSTALLVLASLWSAAAEGPSLVCGAAVLLAALWVMARAWAGDDLVLAGIASGVAVLAVGVEAGLVAALTGSSAGTAVACAGSAALAASTLFLLVLPRPLAAAAEVSAWYLHGLALLAIPAAATGDAGAGSMWRITLLSGVVAGGIRVARGGGDLFAILVASEALALWWHGLVSEGVHAPEPYSLPLAGVLALAGLMAQRRVGAGQPRPGSWVTTGPALLVAAVPTVWLSLLEPGGVRPLLALVVGMAVLAAGSFHGRRALVDVGAATVGVLGIARLLPVLADAPNWLTIGMTGAVLVAVGATFEQRRQDARGMRDRYSALR